jgi:hypothetical protein
MTSEHGRSQQDIGDLSTSNEAIRSESFTLLQSTDTSTICDSSMFHRISIDSSGINSANEASSKDERIDLFVYSKPIEITPQIETYYSHCINVILAMNMTILQQLRDKNEMRVGYLSEIVTSMLEDSRLHCTRERRCLSFISTNNYTVWSYENASHSTFQHCMQLLSKAHNQQQQQQQQPRQPQSHTALVGNDTNVGAGNIKSNHIRNFDLISFEAMNNILANILIFLEFSARQPFTGERPIGKG